MSNNSKSPESELGLDLDLHFLPSWAQKPPEAHPFNEYAGEEGQRREGRDRGPHRGPPGGGRDRGPRFEQRRDRPPNREGAPRGPGRPEGRDRGPRGDRGDRGDRGRGPRGPQRGPQQEREEVKLPELEVSFLPEERGVESLARQIKLSGRSYPLFEIAYLVLKKPERYHIQFASKKKPDGQPVQPLYICGLDDTLWLNENDAVSHVLDKHFATFYSSEKIPTEPPKGTYTFVAQCGMSGLVLGPPNYHDYQTKLRKLHADRFSRMPFDVFKSRIKIVKDEAVVKKWLEEQSFRTEYTCLNIPETIKLQSRDEVEKHFRQTHLANVVKPVDNYTLPGTAIQTLSNPLLHRLLRHSWDDQMRFPIKVVTNLSQQFARHGLQFFKVNKSITHVAIARPHFLDMEETPVSEGIRKIVEFINSHPKSTRRKLIEALAPATTQPPAHVVEAQPAPAAEGTTTEAAGATPSAAPAPQTPPEVAAINSDLHWLVHQGHVIEFANGILETAKKPLPRPPKPPKKAETQPAQGEAPTAPAEAAPEAEVTTDAGVVAGEGSHAETHGEHEHEPAQAEAEGHESEAPAEAHAETPSAEAVEAAAASGEAEKSEPAHNR
jgi:hypothetical protein